MYIKHRYSATISASKVCEINVPIIRECWQIALSPKTRVLLYQGLYVQGHLRPYERVIEYSYGTFIQCHTQVQKAPKKPLYNFLLNNFFCAWNKLNLFKRKGNIYLFGFTTRCSTLLDTDSKVSLEKVMWHVALWPRVTKTARGSERPHSSSWKSGGWWRLIADCLAQNCIFRKQRRQTFASLECFSCNTSKCYSKMVKLSLSTAWRHIQGVDYSSACS